LLSYHLSLYNTHTTPPTDVFNFWLKMRFKFTLQHVYLSILLAFIIATPVGASSTTEPGATVTSLPPASPEGNNNDPCAFADRQSLINRIDGNFERYNISLLVESCPNVCLLVFGAGNPDMSGIGASSTQASSCKINADFIQAMVSYIIQGIAVFFFGPVIAVAALVFRLDLSSQATRKPGFTTLLAKISLGINQGASFIALSICIACIIRIKQAPPMAEIFFIAWLGRFQLFVSIGAVWASWLLYRFDHRRVISILGCFVLVYVMLCISESMSAFPTSQGRTFENFSHYCIKESRYLFAMDAKNAKVKVFNLKTRLILFILLIVPITFMATHRFFQGAVSSLAVYFNTSPSRIMSFVFIPPYTVIWIYQCSEMAFNLYHLRREIKRFAGDLYQDEQWGFGQVTILLLWASVVNDIVLGIMGK